MLLGAVIAAIFANDGAALILTPIIIQMLLALKFPPAAALGFVMATGFIADAGSLPLVVSNLVNIVSADYFDISFARYALVMVPVGIVTVITSLAVLFLYFRKSIPKSYDVSDLPAPLTAVTDVVTFRTGWVVLGLLLIGYFSADPLGIPLSVVAGSAAIVLILVAARVPRFLFCRVIADADRAAVVERAALLDDATASEDSAPDTRTGVAVQKRISVGSVIKGAPWQIVLFSIGMYLVVYGLRNQGLTDELAKVFGGFGDQGVLAAALGTGVVVAVLASLMNNMPTVLIAALAIGAAGRPGSPTRPWSTRTSSDLTSVPRSRPSAASPRCSGCTCSTGRACTVAGGSTSALASCSPSPCSSSASSPSRAGSWSWACSAAGRP